MIKSLTGLTDKLVSLVVPTVRASAEHCHDSYRCTDECSRGMKYKLRCCPSVGCTWVGRIGCTC
ncbi:hypothetical protein [Nonomuraea sp. NPDC001831]|uniref:hypothetical protein n=1 Tax=Nonomuraea sp. NPDC001831 TaxID=3364340 RepID=UPI0036BEA49A